MGKRIQDEAGGAEWASMLDAVLAFAPFCDAIGGPGVHRMLVLPDKKIGTGRE